MGGWGWVGYGCVKEVFHACTHTHTHMHMYVKHAKHGCLHVSGHLQFLYMYTCACVHTCGDTPHAPRCPHPPAPYPEPQGAQNTKIQ